MFTACLCSLHCNKFFLFRQFINRQQYDIKHLHSGPDVRCNEHTHLMCKFEKENNF